MSLVVNLIGAGAVEFVINHAEVSIAFVEEKKIPEVYNWFFCELLLLKSDDKICCQ